MVRKIVFRVQSHVTVSLVTIPVCVSLHDPFSVFWDRVITVHLDLRTGCIITIRVVREEVLGL